MKKLFAIDTNLLVYSHHLEAKYHQSAKAWLERIMNERDEQGNLSVCLPAQILMEFVNVIAWQQLKQPLSLSEAKRVVQDYVDTGIRIIYQRDTHIETFLSLLGVVKSRKQIFDVSLAAVLKDHGIVGLYTVDVTDFEVFNFSEVINPLSTEGGVR